MIVKFDETPGIAGVYLIICRETREYYVGESKDIVRYRLCAYRRIERGASSSQKLLANKLRARYADLASPQFEMWLLDTGLHDEEERLSRETHWDNYWSARGCTRLNTARTGQRSPMLGRSHCTETRAKLSEAMRGKMMPPRTTEHRAKLSETKRGERNPNFGKKPNAETRAKLSEAMRGARNPNFGKRGVKLTVEHRAKLSDAHRGKSLSPEHRAKISAAGLRRWAKTKAQTKAE